MAVEFQNSILSGSLNISGSYNLPTIPDLDTLGVIGEIAVHNEVPYVYTSTGWESIGDNTTLLLPSADIEYLVVAGGGGGGQYIAGGGGAGGMLSSSLLSIESGSSISVTVGAGGSKGASGVAFSANGNDSSIASSTGTTFTTITSTGGGGGAQSAELTLMLDGTYATGSQQGADGGSGGGGSYRYAPNQHSGLGGAGTSGQGNDGGNGDQSGYTFGGGGGGAGGAGSSAGSGGSTPTPGGVGKASNVTGTSTTYAAGGAGGGNANSGFPAVVDATANTGNGGVGSFQGHGAGNGGSGVVILAYDSGSMNAAGGIVGDAGNGRKYNQFNSSGTFYIGSSTDFEIVTDNLILHLDAGDYTSYPGTGQTWYDLSGNGYDLTLGNTSCWNRDGYMDFTATGAKYLPGNTLTNIPNTDGECTIQLWSKFLSSPSSWRTLVRGYGGDHHVIVDGTSPYVSIGRYDNDSAGFVDSGYDINSISNYLTEFHNMVFKFNNSSPYWSFYYDDNLSTPAASITSANATNNRGFAGVGSYHQNNSTVSDHSQYWGYISIFLAYNGTLTEAQMQQNYNAFSKRFKV